MSRAWRPAAFPMRRSARSAPTPLAERLRFTRHSTAARSLPGDAVAVVEPAPRHPAADALEVLPRTRAATAIDAATESRPRVIRDIEVLPYGDPVSPPGASVPFLTFVYTPNF